MIGVIDYGLCNVKSVCNMLRRIGAEATLLSTPDDVTAAITHYILPGVGAFDAGMAQLREKGFDALLQEHVVDQGKPLLGICLGMQMLCHSSEEGETAGLGWVDADVKRFDQSGDCAGWKVPHMGWNVVQDCGADPLFAGLSENRFYFVHSYYVRCHQPDVQIGTTAYGAPFASSIRRGHIWGVQFHPEKSHRFGMQLLKNFSEYSHD